MRFTTTRSVSEIFVVNLYTESIVWPESASPIADISRKNLPTIQTNIPTYMSDSWAEE